MIRFAVLGSGSSGNCSVVSMGHDHVLIDIGLSARQIEQRLESIGLAADQISAVVLTHEHSDHTCGLDVFLRKRAGLPVFATSHTCAVVKEGLRRQPKWQVFHAGDAFSVGTFEVESFSVPHDAVDPVGFVFRGEGLGLGSLSDTGHVTHLIRERLRDLDALHVEANYDEMLLQNDRKRPWATKQRISSRHGHLSNTQAADLVAEVASERLRWVVLNHLSKDCNNPPLAGGEVGKALRQRGLDQVTVHCASQKTPLPFLEIRPSAPACSDPLAADSTGRDQAGAASTQQSHHSSPARGLQEDPSLFVHQLLPLTEYVQQEWGFEN